MFGLHIVIPRKFRKYVLEHLDTGHFDMLRMKSEAKESVWWPNVNEDTENLVHKCETYNTFARNELQNKLIQFRMAPRK